MLDLTNIHKAFFPGTINEKVALAGVDLHLAAGDFCTVIGSNGAGKSTLLNVIAGRYQTLRMGDLIFTGTPAGTGPVAIGDRLEGYLGEERVLELAIK